MPPGLSLALWIIIAVAGVLLFLAGLGLMIYIFALKTYHQIFDRPYPRPPYDKSPLKIEQKTMIGRGKNWFYTNRMDFSDIQITSFDRIKLAAYYRPPENKKNRALIVLIHGWKDHPSDMGAYAQMILNHTDCHILIPHLRAHGMSKGRFIGYGLYDSQDILFWIRFMEKRLEGPLKIILYGRSMGAVTALLAAASNKTPASVCGVIADSPFDSLEKQIQSVVKKRFHFRGRLLTNLVGNIARKRIGFPIKKAVVSPVAGRIKIPVLLLHGAEDQFVSLTMSEGIYNRLNCPKRMVIFDNAGHLNGFDVSPRQYSDEIKKFLRVCKVG
ncbi:MAG: alpha/beta fold hydrolase [Clostridiaceae bacterium]|nr:alpha/beta fold hydrolase [Clostridiaceae bacterium]